MNLSVSALRTPLLDLKAQFAPIREEVLRELTRLVDSQQFILGAEVAAFEDEIAGYIGAAPSLNAIGCANGTDALFLALLAHGISAGDRVLTTPFTFFATAGAISRLGAIPVFVDIDPATYNIDPAALAAAARRTLAKAVIPVHLFGGTADMDPIMATASEHGMVVIEDAAQAIGAAYKGRPAGAIGDSATFSFFPSKNLGCFGDGGLVTTADPALAAKLKALRVHGRSGAAYDHDWIGVNSRLDALQAAVLRVKLKYLDEWTAGRQRNAARYRDLLGGLPVALPKPAPYQTRHIFNQFVIRCGERDRLRAWLRDNEVSTEVYYPIPLHLQTCYSDLGYRPGDFPVSEKAAGEVLALPVFGELTRDQIEWVASLIRSFHG